MPVVLSINSHVVAGRVGNGAALPAFAALGIEAWALPTVIYSNTPGPGGFTGESVDTGVLGAILDRFEADGSVRRLDAIHIGYVREADQARRLARFVMAARRQRSDLFVSLDPVLGDEGRLYTPEAAAEAIKRELVPIADLVTPNLFELSWLTGRKAWSLPGAPPPRALPRAARSITSAPAAATRARRRSPTKRGASRRDAARQAAPHGTGDAPSPRSFSAGSCAAQARRPSAVLRHALHRSSSIQWWWPER
ncbi:MAG: bifunctional hydroxymethylpyrimidine kinase/phosphomethylpyrimidine kinase [Alphaproteobacteria bacterium]